MGGGAGGKESLERDGGENGQREREARAHTQREKEEDHKEWKEKKMLCVCWLGKRRRKSKNSERGRGRGRAYLKCVIRQIRQTRGMCVVRTRFSPRSTRIIVHYSSESPLPSAYSHVERNTSSRNTPLLRILIYH